MKKRKLMAMACAGVLVMTFTFSGASVHATEETEAVDMQEVAEEAVKELDAADNPKAAAGEIFTEEQEEVANEEVQIEEPAKSEVEESTAEAEPETETGNSSTVEAVSEAEDSSTGEAEENNIEENNTEKVEAEVEESLTEEQVEEEKGDADELWENAVVEYEEQSGPDMASFSMTIQLTP